MAVSESNSSPIPYSLYREQSCWMSYYVQSLKLFFRTINQGALNDILAWHNKYVPAVDVQGCP